MAKSKQIPYRSTDARKHQSGFCSSLLKVLPQCENVVHIVQFTWSLRFEVTPILDRLKNGGSCIIKKCAHKVWIIVLLYNFNLTSLMYTKAHIILIYLLSNHSPLSWLLYSWVPLESLTIISTLSNTREEHNWLKQNSSYSILKYRWSDNMESTKDSEMEDLSFWCFGEREACNLFQVRWHKGLRFEAAALDLMPQACTEPCRSKQVEFHHVNN